MANISKKNKNRRKSFLIRSRETYKRALNSTMIEIEANTLCTLINRLLKKDKEHNGIKPACVGISILLQPLFTNYAVHTTLPDFNKEGNVIEKSEKFDEIMLVNWLTDTKYTIDWIINKEAKLRIIVDNEQFINGDNSAILCEIFYKGKMVIMNFAEWKEKVSKNGMGLDDIMKSVIAVTDYMLNYSTEVEYEIVERGAPVSKDKDTKGATSKPVTSPQSSNTITITSKRKKYIITADMVKESKKQYNKRTACWNVRGYYQHFGKDKVLKYIPPRVNVRKDMSGTAENKKYIIKGDNNNGTN